jgi:hypothetical protein
MKTIIPTKNILIAGVHSPAGEPVKCEDAVASSLIIEGLAIEKKPSPVIETAAAAPVQETATTRRKK